MKEIKQFKPFIGLEEYESIKQCFETNWITEGKLAEQFSKELCDLIGCKYGVFANNGTLSLYLGLKALGIGPGDEVLVPDFTFIASANSVIMTGAIPILVDVDPDTYHIDLEKAKTKLTKKTKAMMPVHIYGTAANMDEIMAFAKDNNLLVIEDAAQAIGVKWNGKHCGSFGDVGSFSFFADKTITTGEGGFVCTDNYEIYQKMLFLRNQGRINRGSFIHPQVGYNFRITDIQAAIGLTQIKKLPDIINKKQKILSRYCEKLQHNERVKIFKPPKNSNHIPFRVAITLDQNKDQLMDFLKENKVETRTFFYPLHKQPCFSCLENNDCKNSIDLYETGVCLPSYPTILQEEIDYVCEVINNFYEKH